MDKAKKCPKCGGSFVKGVIADSNYVTIAKAGWAKDINAGGIFGLGVKDKKELLAYRCDSCGFVELYTK